MALHNIPDIVAELSAGRMVILVDEEDRENEGDLVLAADFVTPQAINFMATHGRGLICLTLTRERCQALNLPLMVRDNGSQHGTNFTLSIEAATGVSTGISAADRARTIQVAVANDTKPTDLVQPGHIFPLMAADGGVLARAGHTEAGCDLSALAGCTPAAVICEILKDDGSMARLPDLLRFAEQHDLKVGAIADLIQYRSAHESLVRRAGARDLQTPWGTFHAIAYRDLAHGAAHLALVHGTIEPAADTWVRVHEPTSLLDLLDTADTTTHAWSLGRALSVLRQQPAGVLVMLNCGDAPDALLTRWASPASPPVARVDLRTYGIGAQILRDLGVRRMRLLARPRKMPSMAGFDLTVTGYLSDENAA